jgi:simple sugar transport system ATP-binding protein
MTQFANKIIEQFNVMCSGTEALAGSLSGGNLQKFIVGREIALQPKLLLSCATYLGCGYWFKYVNTSSIIGPEKRGVAIVVISEELEELMMISDQITVIANGILSPQVPTHQTDVQALGVLMSGQALS